MSINLYLSETDQYLGGRKAALSEHLSILENLSTGVDNSFGLLKNKTLSNIESIISQFASFGNHSQAYDDYVTGFIEDVMDSPTSDEDGARQNLKVLSILGSIFASESSAPHYFAKKTADEFAVKLQDRASLLNQISLNLSNVRLEIENINSTWYDNYLVDTTNAMNDVNNAIEHMLSVRSFANLNNLNEGEIQLVKNNVTSAIGHLNRVNTPVSTMNLASYAENLKNDIETLNLLDQEISLLFDNLKSFKTDYIYEAEHGNKFINYVKEVAEKQYSELVSVKNQMREVLSRGDAAMSLRQAPDWIIRLSTIGAFSEDQSIDFTSAIIDPFNADTIKLDAFILGLNDATSQIDTSLYDTLKSVTGKVIQKINIDIDSTSLLSEIDSAIVSVTDDSAASTYVILHCEAYKPTIVETINEFIDFIESLDLDRLKHILLSSRWRDIFNLTQSHLTFSDILSQYIDSFISTIEDDELRSIIFRLYYQIQSDRRINRIKSFTFELARERAVDELRTGQIRKVDVMLGDFQSISRRLGNL